MPEDYTIKATITADASPAKQAFVELSAAGQKTREQLKQAFEDVTPEAAKLQAQVASLSQWMKDNGASGTAMGNVVREAIASINRELDALIKKYPQAGDAAAKTGKRTVSELTEARHAAMGLGEVIGMRLPRMLSTFIASIEGMTPVLAAAFDAVAVIMLIQWVYELGKKISEAAEKAEKAKFKLHEAWADATLALQTHNDELALSNIKLQETIDRIEKKPDNAVAKSLAEAVVEADKLTESLRKGVREYEKLIEEAKGLVGVEEALMIASEHAAGPAAAVAAMKEALRLWEEQKTYQKESENFNRNYLFMQEQGLRNAKSITDAAKQKQALDDLAVREATELAREETRVTTELGKWEEKARSATGFLGDKAKDIVASLADQLGYITALKQGIPLEKEHAGLEGQVNVAEAGQRAATAQMKAFEEAFAKQKAMRVMDREDEEAYWGMILQSTGVAAVNREAILKMMYGFEAAKRQEEKRTAETIAKSQVEFDKAMALEGIKADEEALKWRHAHKMASEEELIAGLKSSEDRQYTETVDALLRELALLDKKDADYKAKSDALYHKLELAAQAHVDKIAEIEREGAADRIRVAEDEMKRKEEIRKSEADNAASLEKQRVDDAFSWGRIGALRWEHEQDAIVHRTEADKIAAVRQRLEDERKLHGENIDDEKKAADEIDKIHRDAGHKIAQIHQQTVEKLHEQWKQFTQTFNSDIEKMLMHQETFAEGMKHIWANMISFFIQKLLEWLEEEIWVHVIMKALHMDTGNAADKQIKDNVRVAESDAAVAAAAAFMWTMSQTGNIAAALTQAAIVDAIGQTFVVQAHYEQGGIVPKDQIARLHEREMVLPKHVSEFIMKAAAGGGTTNNSSNINIRSSIDMGGSGGRVPEGTDREVAKMFKRAYRMGAMSGFKM